MNLTPPRLLTGAIVLVWGGLTGNTTWGLLTALLIESKSWTTLRWDFKRESYIRAWQFSIFLGALIAILAWINGLSAGRLHTLFVWAPLTLLPLELAQRYGKATMIPLNTFSFFARKKMERDIAQGRVTSPRMINTGYLYIGVVILATSMASRNDLQHFIGMSLMVAACLFFSVWKNGFRPLAWSIALILTLSLGYAGHWGMFKLYHHFTGARGGDGGQHTSTNESRTSIGKLGKLKLSPKIFWRMKVHDGRPPRLIRTATYNYYSHTRWIHEFIPPLDDSRRDEYDYVGATEILMFADRDTRTFGNETDLSLSDHGNVSIIGEVNSRVEENPIPLPHQTLVIGDLGQGTALSTNSLGTVRIGNPENHVVEYTVWIGDKSTVEEDPLAEFDLNIPAREKAAIERVATQLGLKERGLSTADKISILRRFFIHDFRYTTHLRTPKVERGKMHTAVGMFLEKTRSGHCEYFATAAALLLREAGVPTRYSVGFSVHEHDRDRNEWVMRGHHAHAWCRVWVEEKNDKGETVGQWQDVDFTPASWLEMDALAKPDWQRKLTDWWQRVREDFLIWRTKEANKTKVAIAVGAIIALLLLWIIWRLWGSRQRKTTRKRQRYRRPNGSPLTALHRLEPLIAKRIGHRPEGVPLCRWIMEFAQNHSGLHRELKQVTELHSQVRFDPAGVNEQHLEELNRLCTESRKRIKSL